MKTSDIEKIRKARLEGFEAGKKMSQEEAQTQMRRNGSVSSPNPWYREPKKKDVARP
jgi:hypothetical protein